MSADLDRLSGTTEHQIAEKDRAELELRALKEEGEKERTALGLRLKDAREEASTSQATVDKNIAITEVCRDLLARAREQSTVQFIKVKGHLHEELAKVGVKDVDLAPGETYQDLGNVRADELATRAMWSGEHSGYNLT